MQRLLFVAGLLLCCCELDGDIFENVRVEKAFFFFFVPTGDEALQQKHFFFNVITVLINK